MAHLFETGWTAHQPAWHGLGDIKQQRPTTWDEAKQGYLDWEPTSSPVYENINGTFIPVPGWNVVRRDDTNIVLAVQQDSYAVIGNNEFGGLIEYAMGVDLPGLPKLQFDALCVLKGGRLIVTTMYLEEPITVPGDESPMYPLLAFWTRHDGLGGMKCGATTIRVVCANTQTMAEHQMDLHGFVFNIRHTKNWAEKMEEARHGIVGALANIKTWEALASQLALKAVDTTDVRNYLDKWLPFSTAMTDLQKTNVEAKRAAFYKAYDSQTCESIYGTAWGVLQASIEAADHYFPAWSEETRTARILLGTDNYKLSALRLAKKM